MVLGVLGGAYFVAHLKGQAQLYVGNSAINANIQVRPRPASQNLLNSHSRILTRIKEVNVRLGRTAFALLPNPVTSRIVVPVPKTLAKSTPIRLVIPKIEVDTQIVPVDVRPAGDIALPDSFRQVGWYDRGPTAGELGPAIIVGHVDSTEGIAVFWRLRELALGDTFQVYRADGTTAVFKVLEVDQFSQSSFPAQNVYGNIKYAGIRLITCGGTFNSVTRHYDQNTVVYGTLE